MNKLVMHAAAPLEVPLRIFVRPSMLSISTHSLATLGLFFYTNEFAVTLTDPIILVTLL